MQEKIKTAKLEKLLAKVEKITNKNVVELFGMNKPVLYYSQGPVKFKHDLIAYLRETETIDRFTKRVEEFLRVFDA